MDSAGNPYTDQRSMSPGSTDLSSGGGSPPLAGIQQPPMLSPSPGVPGADDEIIPTAIVIKNIPFNVKRETLLDIIVRPSPLFCPARPSLNVALSRRLLCQFLPRTRSIITSTSRASSAVLPLPTSARR